MQTHPAPDTASILKGASAPMVLARRMIEKVAAARCNVLITGETGTGKEVVARLIHENSSRRSARLVSFNCAALPDTLIESELFGYERGAFTGAQMRNEGRIAEANGGTLFLDEIGEMTLSAQAKVLRCLETRELQRLGGRGTLPVDVRILAATNQSPEDMVGHSTFRKDLFFRLNVARIHLPPLRERSEDIPELAHHFLRGFSESLERAPKGFTSEALSALKQYVYPGNVRELRNFIEVALIHQPYPLIESEHLPPMVCSSTGNDEDRNRILEVLRVAKWNKSEAAKTLHWSRMTLYRKMARYAITDEGDAKSA